MFDDFMFGSCRDLQESFEKFNCVLVTTLSKIIPFLWNIHFPENHDTDARSTFIFVVLVDDVFSHNRLTLSGIFFCLH